MNIFRKCCILSRGHLKSVRWKAEMSFQPIYFHLYSSNMKSIFVDNSRSEPTTFITDFSKTLIRPFHGKSFIKTVRGPSWTKHMILFQFYIQLLYAGQVHFNNTKLMFAQYYKVKKKRQRAEIDTFEYHTWPETPYRNVTKTHKKHNTQESQEVSPLSACDHKAARNRQDL